MIAGSKSFAALGQWAADAGPDVLASLGADRGAAEESTYRRAFALVSADVLDRLLGAWLWTRAADAGDRLVIAIDGKTGEPPSGTEYVLEVSLSLMRNAVYSGLALRRVRELGLGYVLAATSVIEVSVARELRGRFSVKARWPSR